MPMKKAMQKNTGVFLGKVTGSSFLREGLDKRAGLV
jgi:hypothetical protein